MMRRLSSSNRSGRRRFSRKPSSRGLRGSKSSLSLPNLTRILANQPLTQGSQRQWPQGRLRGQSMSIAQLLKGSGHLHDWFPHSHLAHKAARIFAEPLKDSPRGLGRPHSVPELLLKHFLGGLGSMESFLELLLKLLILLNRNLEGIRRRKRETSEHAHLRKPRGLSPQFVVLLKVRKISR